MQLGSLLRVQFADRQQSEWSVGFGMPTLMWIGYLERALKLSELRYGLLVGMGTHPQ